MISIPIDIYNHSLLVHLYPLAHRKNENQQEAQLLQRICQANLVDKWTEANEYIDNIRLSNAEKQIIHDGNYCSSDNMEIKARSNDVMRNGSRAYSAMSVTASESYLSLYKKDHDCFTIVRSLIVRGSSNIDAYFMDRFLSTIEDSVLYSHILNRIITYLNKTKTTISHPWKDRLIDYVSSRIKAESLKDSYEQYRGYINNMYLLGQLSIEKRERDIALACEQEADKKIANREPNTFYMGLDQLYKDGLKRITPYREKHLNIYNRLWNKLCRQQQHIADMMNKLPPFKISISEDIQNMTHQLIDSIEIKEFADIARMYMSISYIKGKCQKILKEKSGKDEHSILSKFGSSQQNEHGNIIGRESPEDSKKLHLYQYNRFFIEYYLSVAINHAIASKLEITRNNVAELLQAIGSKHIDNRRFGLIVEGLYQGFTYNFVIAAHLLIPQLEHFLHDIDEQVLNKDLTKLTQERQEEYTLEQILTDLKKVNESIFDELDFFLCHGSDVNFRNKMVHGLMELSEMEHHAHYFWWICLYLFLEMDKVVKKK